MKPNTTTKTPDTLDETALSEKFLKLSKIEILYQDSIDKYEADYSLYNDIDLYANLYKLNKERERNNKVEAFNYNEYLKGIDDPYILKVLRKEYNNDKVTIDILVDAVIKRVLSNTDIRFLLYNYGKKVNLVFDHEYCSYIISNIAKNLYSLYLALEKEVFINKEFYYKLITVINARTKNKDNKHYLLAVANLNNDNNHKAVISFIDNDKHSLFKYLINKYYPGDIYDYSNHKIVNNNPMLKVIYHPSFKESKTSDILYSIINTALLNKLNVNAYLTYLFNKFMDKEMEDPFKYLPWNEEILRRFRE